MEMQDMFNSAAEQGQALPWPGQGAAHVLLEHLSPLAQLLQLRAAAGMGMHGWRS